MRHPFRRKNLSPRLLPVYALAVAVLLVAEPRPAGLAAGAVLVGAGLALRLWTAGHLVKNRCLAVSGPYARLRHPLYAGTLLVACGLGVAAGGWATVLALGGFLPLFFLYYVPFKERIESARLERRYGAPYRAYRRSVPMLWPARRPWWPPTGTGLDSPAERGWRSERVGANDEWGTLAAASGGLLLLALRALA